MSEHLLAWQESIDQSTLGDINTVADNIVTRSGADRYLVPNEYNWIHWAMASGVSITRAQIQAPSLDVRRMNLEVLPRAQGDDELTLSHPQIWIPPRPISLRPTEELAFRTAEDGAGATQQNGFVALGTEALPPMPDGDIRVVRATGTTTLAAFAWTSVTLTPETSLEPGMYALVGFIAISATGIVARANLQGQSYRPGMPCLPGTEAVAADFEASMINQLMFYNMGQFSHVAFPEFQFFAVTTDSAETVIMYVIRTGDLVAS
tara:strand:- start:2969 stop:3757 length:789 start_codon:yes stop_codon:yes gene_type:complete